LDGKVALVTGAGQGVGLGIALALASEGARLSITGRVEGKLADAAARIRLRGSEVTYRRCDGKIAADVAVAVDHTIDTFGTVDILVNNAQQTILGVLHELSDEDFSASWESGPGAALRFMRACHPHLEGGGVVLNLGSASGLDPKPTFAAYAAVKEGIRAITRVAALEWGKDGIRVNALLPLAMTESMVAWREKDPDGYKQVEANIALGRFGDPESDVGAAAVFLVSPQSGYITGTTMMVDGGQTWLH
jgi:NAD(P)-dependent dehydrogenase (short-subunit alcohol dehydrogenase family)